MIQIDEIYESTCVVDAPKRGRWKPDLSMLMHLAQYDTFSKEEVGDMLHDGMNPQKVKLTIACSVEYID